MPKFKALPPLEELQKAFNYDPDTGVFTHAYRKPGRAKDSVAGTTDAQGYIILKHKSVLFKSSRVAWLFVTGEDPGDSIVDHKDRNKSNNRASNLRLVTDRENVWNTEARGWFKDRNSYRACIGHYGKMIHLGSFGSAEEAQAAYRSKAVELRGEFAPAEYDGRLLDSSPG